MEGMFIARTIFAKVIALNHV